MCNEVKDKSEYQLGIHFLFNYAVARILLLFNQTIF